MNVDLRHGDCVELMRAMPDCSVDSVVTDPPYELGFMGKAWDGAGIAYSLDMWREVLRVLKPGGHLLAFGGTRTYHRMACAIEDAGFEIRDSIHWVYGSGFPKSLDVSKAIDKRGGYPHLAAQIGAALKVAREQRGMSVGEADRLFCDGTTNWTWFEGRPRGQRAPTPDTFARIVAEWPELKALAAMVAEAEREVVGTKTSGIANREEGPRHTIGASKAVEVDVTTAATDEARRWAGWGTALKPAHEPVVVARKPLQGTVAGNVLVWGTGGLNIDGCRVGTDGGGTNCANRDANGECAGHPAANGSLGGGVMRHAANGVSGRWPANIVLDGAAADALDKQSGERAHNPPAVWKRAKGDAERTPTSYAAPTGDAGEVRGGYGDRGGASRFFTQADFGPDDWPFVYCAKPSKRERNAGLDSPSTHPTVKPVALMRHLVRLVTPPGGTVLDPFAGSGTTLVAAVLEGMNAIGCEMTDEYLPIIEGRVAWAQEQAQTAAEAKANPEQPTLL